MEIKKNSHGEYGEAIGNTKLSIDETVLAEGTMKTQLAKFTLSGDGLCTGYYSRDNVS